MLHAFDFDTRAGGFISGVYNTVLWWCLFCFKVPKRLVSDFCSSKIYHFDLEMPGVPQFGQPKQINGNTSWIPQILALSFSIKMIGGLTHVICSERFRGIRYCHPQHSLSPEFYSRRAAVSYNVFESVSGHFCVRCRRMYEPAMKRDIGVYITRSWTVFCIFWLPLWSVMYNYGNSMPCVIITCIYAWPVSETVTKTVFRLLPICATRKFFKSFSESYATTKTDTLWVLTASTIFFSSGVPQMSQISIIGLFFNFATSKNRYAWGICCTERILFLQSSLGSYVVQILIRNRTFTTSNVSHWPDHVSDTNKAKSPLHQAISWLKHLQFWAVLCCLYYDVLSRKTQGYCW